MIPRPAVEWFYLGIGQKDHLAIVKISRHGGVSAGITGVVEVELVPQLVANVVVVEAAPEALAGCAFPMFDQQAAVQFRGDFIVADDLTIRGFHLPLADPRVDWR